MSTDPSASSLLLAEARVAAARQRLGDTAARLQTRLDPRLVARDAVEGITETGEKALRSGVETARAYPNVAMGALTLAVALLTRRRIAAAFRRRKPAATDPATAASLARSIPGDWPATAERNEI